MTNYEKLFSLEEIAKQRTKCVSYSCGYTYVNDVGRFSSDEHGDEVYKIAVEAEISWLNKEAM
jgi:hypothetical protein